MSQFPGAYQDPFTAPTGMPAKTSGLAITSLVCSLVICCPVATLLGPLLGLIAIPKIGSNPMLKGKGMAVAAIIIGLLVSAGWGVGIVVVGLPAYRLYKQGEHLVMVAPGEAMVAAFAGDNVKFRSYFHGAGAAASDVEVAAFVDAVKARYGVFNSVELEQQQQVQPQPGQPSIELGYTFHFANAKVGGAIEHIFADPNPPGGIVMKFGGITIHDSNLGDLSFPAGPAIGGSGKIAPPTTVPATSGP